MTFHNFNFRHTPKHVELCEEQRQLQKSLHIGRTLVSHAVSYLISPNARGTAHRPIVSKV